MLESEGKVQLSHGLQNLEDLNGKSRLFWSNHPRYQLKAGKVLLLFIDLWNKLRKLSDCCLLALPVLNLGPLPHLLTDKAKVVLQPESCFGIKRLYFYRFILNCRLLNTLSGLPVVVEVFSGSSLLINQLGNWRLIDCERSGFFIVLLDCFKRKALALMQQGRNHLFVVEVWVVNMRCRLLWPAIHVWAFKWR